MAQKGVNVTLYMDKEVRARLTAYAKATHTSISSVVSSALKAYLDPKTNEYKQRIKDQIERLQKELQGL